MRRQFPFLALLFGFISFMITKRVDTARGRPDRKRLTEERAERRSARIITVLAITTAVFTIATAMATIWLGVVGLLAYREYYNTNKIALRTRLEQRDNDIASIYLEDRRQDFSSIFAEFDYGTNPSFSDIQSVARQHVSLFLRNANNPEKLLSQPPLINNIPEFSCSLWKGEHYMDQTMVYLRRAYHLAEAYLYLVHQAWEAKEAGIFDEEAELEYWAPYVDLMSYNPMFLAALHEGHRLGFIDLKFSLWVQQRILADGDISRRNMLCVLYPELLRQTGSNTWEARYGEEKFCEPEPMSPQERRMYCPNVRWSEDGGSAKR